MRPRLTLAALILTLPLAAAGQPLQDVAVLTPHVIDAVVPAVSAHGAAFRDYRGAYGVYYVDLSTGQERRLAPILYAEPGVAAAGGRVAWVGYPTLAQADVYVHDLAANATTRLTQDALFHNHPRLSESLLVWQRYRSGNANADIYAHDFATGQTFAVSAGPAYQDLPAVWGRRVVWQDYRHAGPSLATAEIYLRDLDGGSERRLTVGDTYRTHPAIWEHLVVWEDYRNGSNGDIYLYDLTTETERAIATHPAQQTMPAVNGEWVLWLDYRNDPYAGDLYGYHLPTGQEHALFLHPAHQEPPKVHESTVVWQDYRGGRQDLYRGALAGTTSAEGPPASTTSRLGAFPNPFRTSVTLQTPTGAEELIVYDLLGQPVRRIPAPDGEAAWDGRDAAGRTLPAGVYVVRASGGGAVRVTLCP